LPRRPELRSRCAARQRRVRDIEGDFRAGAAEAGCGRHRRMSILQGAHRFEAFVVGTANRTAVTAGRAVANAPGAAYNPLLIYARPGMGKTHLLGAIAHQVFAVNPAARIEFLTLDEFVEGFHVALSTGDSDRFRARF